jgi:hypothetical protein
LLSSPPAKLFNQIGQASSNHSPSPRRFFERGLQHKALSVVQNKKTMYTAAQAECPEQCSGLVAQNTVGVLRANHKSRLTLPYQLADRQHHPA